MKMKKLTSLCGCLLLSMCMGVGAMTAPLSAEAAAREKVILDADMVDLFDDGIAMMMLAESPKMDLKGVTIVIGNTWVETGTASAIRQLEGIGRTDIPVYMGVNETVRKDRFANMKEEKRIYGRGHDSHLGAAGYPQPKSWQAEYRKNYNDEPVMNPQKEHAADFIINTIKKHPGEVTIVAIGSGANLAAALDKAPEIAPLAKRVVYMAGAFFCEGNVMPTSEFNVWIDPETCSYLERSALGSCSSCTPMHSRYCIARPLKLLCLYSFNGSSSSFTLSPAISSPISKKSSAVILVFCGFITGSSL
jgi:hypothetical protein